MANPHRGEVDVEIGGRKYLLSFSANALAEMENALGLSLDEINDLMQNGKLRIAQWRAMFCCALQDNHEDIDDAGALALFKQLSLADVIKFVGKAYGLGFNGMAELAAAGNKDAAASPPVPGPSSEPTGPASSTPGPKPAKPKQNSGA